MTTRTVMVCWRWTFPFNERYNWPQRFPPPSWRYSVFWNGGLDAVFSLSDFHIQRTMDQDAIKVFDVEVQGHRLTITGLARIP